MEDLTEWPPEWLGYSAALTRIFVLEETTDGGGCGNLLISPPDDDELARLRTYLLGQSDHHRDPRIRAIVRREHDAIIEWLETWKRNGGSEPPSS